jgi:hypothetical protein
MFVTPDSNVESDVVISSASVGPVDPPDVDVPVDVALDPHPERVKTIPKETRKTPTEHNTNNFFIGTDNTAP